MLRTYPDALTPAAPDDAGMVAAAQRPIDVVPPALLAMLRGAGRLPTLPRPRRQFGYREPTLNELCALTWLLQWHGPRLDAQGMVREPIGLLAYYDHYDFGSASDVREIVYVDGTRRSVIELFRHMIARSREDGRRVVGDIVAGNRRQRKTLRKLGCVVTRHRMEDAP